MKIQNAKPWYIAASIVTIVVLLLVGVMMRVTIPTPDWWDVSGLPLFHAILNGTAAVLIILGGIMIKLGKKTAHRNYMVGAVTLSGLFLLSYVTYHFTSGHTVFGDLDHDGILNEAEKLAVESSKPRYFIILISHIVFATVSFPFILFSIIAAAFQQFTLHKKLVKWAYPMWLYVAITGPVVYYLIKPYY